MMHGFSKFKGAGLMSAAVVLCLATGTFATPPSGVTVTKVHDAVFAGPGGNVFASCYVPTADKFAVSFGGTIVKIISADGTATDNGSLDLTGTAPSGLGFFALCAGSDGVIYGYEDNASVLWRWSNTAAVPTSAASGVAFARSGHVIGTGINTKVCLTGASDDGPIQIWGTADGLTFTLEDTVPASTPGAKSGFAINSTVDKVWAVGDTTSPITKATKSGTWSVAGGFTTDVSTNVCGPMAYDNTNDILFAFSAQAPSNLFYALNPDTGVTYNVGGTATTNAINSTPGYCGAYAQSVAGSGTVWTAGRQATPTNAFLAKFTYTTVSSAQDWNMY